MKSDRELNEQLKKENQTQKSGAKKGTSNAKNYTSRHTGLGLHKMLAALPEEKKGALRTTCFVLLLLIGPITTMSTLVVEIFDRHLGDMKLRRFPKKKNTYGLKEINDALKQAKLERHHDDALRLNLLKIILSFLLPNKGRNVWVKYVDLVDDLQQFNKFHWAMKPSETDMQQDLVQEVMRNHIEAPTIVVAHIIESPIVGAPAIRSSSSTTEIRAVVVRVCSQLEKHGEMLLKLDDHGKMLHNHGKGEWQKKTNANKKNKKAEETDVPLKKKVKGTKKKAFTDKQFDHVLLIQLKTLIPKIPKKGLANRVPRKRRAKFPEVDEFQLTAKNLLQQVAPGEGLEVVKDLVVDDDVEVEMEVNFKTISSEYGGDLLEGKKGDKKYDDKKDVEEKVKSEEEQPQVAGEEDSKPPTIVVYYNGKKMYNMPMRYLQKKRIHNLKLLIFVQIMGVAEVAKTDIVSFNQEELVGEAYQASADQTTIVSVEEQTMEVEKTEDEASHVAYLFFADNFSFSSFIFPYIVSLLSFVVINVYIKALIQYFDTQHRALEDKEKIVGRKICIYNSMVDAKIVNARKKKKLSPRHQRMKDQLSKILSKMLIWKIFVDRSSSPTGSEAKDYGLNSKWITHFGKYQIQPNGNDCGVYMLVFMDNILRGMKFLDLIDGNECCYTINYVVLRLGVEP
ncbi:hypothetical protein GIB67_027665 [Kingdonia uniflora]|uniref:Ubiquitin-like protease family profile domain-containing protein n=1 Tax=Kingdonia uniflora TaxID=39325 RepID=A0A7J7NL11_9MAGN|nr:hypothetical protein GIB67_027665 [Kingdonia uniflora]